MAKDLKRRVLLKALEVVGDRERLATRLGTRKLHLDSWLTGFSEPPDKFFLRAADIILEKSVTGENDSRATDQEHRKRPH
jgi:hypothetical protein